VKYPIVVDFRQNCGHTCSNPPMQRTFPRCHKIVT
jgi:hypothetical protein